MGQGHTIVLHMSPTTVTVQNVKHYEEIVAKASTASNIPANDIRVVTSTGQVLSCEKDVVAWFKDHPVSETLHVDIFRSDELEGHIGDSHVPDKDQTAEEVEAEFTRQETFADDFAAANSFEDAVPESAAFERQTSMWNVEDDQQQKQHCDVLFIGAGPVGLWTAVQLKIRSPQAEIVMLEKYATYQRRHVILLSPASMNERAKGNPAFDEVCDFLSGGGRKTRAVRTNEMEDRLTGLAIKLGIHIIIEAVSDVAQVVERYHPKAVVGSDGSHSIVRKAWMKHGGAATDLSRDDIIERTIQLKYEIHENRKPFSSREIYALAKALPKQFAYFEHIGKPSEKTGKIPVTMVITGLEQQHFDSMSGASFRNPYSLTSNFFSMHPDLRGTAAGYFKAAEVIKSEKRVIDSETIAPVALRLYRTSSFAEHVGPNKVPTFLVGDAAFGVPFFRALNNGFVCGCRLATFLAYELNTRADAARWEENAFGTLAIREYQRFATALCASEFKSAMNKHSAISLARGITQLTKKVPRSLHVFKFSEEHYQEIHKVVQEAAPELPEPVASSFSSSKKMKQSPLSTGYA